MSGMFFPDRGGRHVIKSIELVEDGIFEIRLGPRFDIDIDTTPELPPGAGR